MIWQELPKSISVTYFNGEIYPAKIYGNIYLLTVIK
jgi:hypothetical protein